MINNKKTLLSLLVSSLVLPAFANDTPAHTDNTDWLLYGNTYDNQRHSALTQINDGNIHKLKLQWKYKTGIKSSFQTSPIVANGIMYISTPKNHVVALNAESGKELWRYKHKLTTTKTCCGFSNKGVALAGDKIFEATIDGRLIALNKQTGNVEWEVAIEDTTVNIQETLQSVEGLGKFSGASTLGGTAHSFNMAPQVYNGLVIVGSTGAGYGLHLDTKDGLAVIGVGDGRTGLRGFLAAFDAETGKEVWRWYSVQGPEWIGDWKNTVDGVSLNRNVKEEKEALKHFPHTWKLGGGSIAGTPTIDTETGLMFIGTGNPAPNMDDSTRPGDNRDTSSIVALDSRTGKKVWAFQQVPHDRWGYDVSSPAVLFDVTIDGKKIKAVGQAGKTGWFYVLERTTGKLIYRSEPFVPQKNLFTNPTEDGVYITPAIAGGNNWSPVSVNAEKNRVFIAALHAPVMYYTKKIDSKKSNLPWKSYTYFNFVEDKNDRYGTLTSIDLATGKIDWQHKTQLPMLGGVLSTAGNLVFSGEGNGEFFALDSTTGKKLWSYHSDYGVNAPPMSYRVNGKQYIAVAAGGNKIAKYPVGDELLVFGLKE